MSVTFIFKTVSFTSCMKYTHSRGFQLSSINARKAPSGVQAFAHIRKKLVN